MKIHGRGLLNIIYSSLGPLDQIQPKASLGEDILSVQKWETNFFSKRKREMVLWFFFFEPSCCYHVLVCLRLSLRTESRMSDVANDHLVGLSILCASNSHVQQNVWFIIIFFLLYTELSFSFNNLKNPSAPDQLVLFERKKLHMESYLIEKKNI